MSIETHREVSKKAWHCHSGRPLSRSSGAWSGQRGRRALPTGHRGLTAGLVSRSAPQAHNFEGFFAHAPTDTIRDCPLGGGRSAQMFFVLILKNREFRNGATATKRR